MDWDTSENEQRISGKSRCNDGASMQSPFVSAPAVAGHRFESEIAPPPMLNTRAIISQNSGITLHRSTPSLIYAYAVVTSPLFVSVNNESIRVALMKKCKNIDIGRSIK